jgi:hypothetical protein
MQCPHSLKTALLCLILAWSASSTPPPRPELPAPARRACLPVFDCNGNGIEDSIDIATGASTDLDMNGVPDECDKPLSALQSVRGCGY